MFSLSIGAVPVLGSSIAEAAFIRRSKVRKKLTTSYKVVVGDDASNENVDTAIDSVDVPLSPVGDGPAPTSKTFTLTLEDTKANRANRSAKARLTSFQTTNGFKGKGIRFAGEQIRRKTGKAAGK